MQAIKNFVTGRTDETETQSGKEPVSGQTGAGTTNEPYDAGNTTGTLTSTCTQPTIVILSAMLRFVAIQETPV